MTHVRKLYILLCGFEILPKTVSTRGIGGRFIMSLPISAYLMETENGYVLFDTGYDPHYSRNPAFAATIFHHAGRVPPVIQAQHELDHQLAELGVHYADIGHVILSHLHFDHSGYLKHLKHARISIQRQEYEAAVMGDPGRLYIGADFRDLGLRWDIVEGDWEVMPGLHMVSTPGHTPGHQSAVVDLADSGRMVLVADAGDLRENFDHEILPGGSVDDEAALDSIRWLKELSEGGTLILGHDPVAIQTYRLAPEFYC